MIHSIWVDYPRELKRYIKKKKLRGGKWRTPQLNTATDIRQIMDHKADDKDKKRHLEYQVIWDNGYVSWEDAKNVIVDAIAAVDEYIKYLE